MPNCTPGTDTEAIDSTDPYFLSASPMASFRVVRERPSASDRVEKNPFRSCCSEPKCHGLNLTTTTCEWRRSACSIIRSVEVLPSPHTPNNPITRLVGSALIAMVSAMRSAKGQRPKRSCSLDVIG
jgi:hypothetical protein